MQHGALSLSYKSLCRCLAELLYGISVALRGSIQGPRQHHSMDVSIQPPPSVLHITRKPVHLQPSSAGGVCANSCPAHHPGCSHHPGCFSYLSADVRHILLLSCLHSLGCALFSQCLMRGPVSRDSQSVTAIKRTLGVTGSTQSSKHGLVTMASQGSIPRINSQVGCITRDIVVSKGGGQAGTWPASSDIALAERHDRPTWSAGTGQARADAPLHRFIWFFVFVERLER